jgi:TolA-binding protein
VANSQPAAAPATPAAGAATPPAAAANYSTNQDENQAYDAAVNMVLKEKNYDKAIPAFEGFIKQFPNSSYVPNAHYWLGQLMFNKDRAGPRASSPRWRTNTASHPAGRCPAETRHARPA